MMPKHPVDCHVGKKIRLRRWMMGMTQKQLGDAVGIKFQQIQKYETGMNRVSASRLYDISRVLDTPVSFFFDSIPETRTVGEPQGSDLPHNGAAAIDFFEDKETLELVRCYYEWPEEQRRHLFELTRSLSKAA